MAVVAVGIAVGIGVALQAISETQRAEVCVRNELAYQTTYWDIDKAREDKIWRCNTTTKHFKSTSLFWKPRSVYAATST